MAYPSFNNLAAFAENQAREIQQFVTYLFGWLSSEHNDDGTHKAITADSLALDDNKAAGNVIGNLVPTTATATLGTRDAAGLGTIRRWANVYTDEIDFGSSAIPVTGTLQSVWRLFVSGTNMLWRAGITAAQTITFQTSGVVTLMQVGGSTPLGTSIATDGVTIPNLSSDQTYAVNGFAERSRNKRIGEWTAVAFAAGNFTGSGSMTWTVGSGDQDTFAYWLVGKTMTVAFALSTTTVGGVASGNLMITIPASQVAARTMYDTFWYSDNGTAGIGRCSVVASGTTIVLVKPTGATWDVTSVDNTYVYGQISFEVQ